MQMRAKSYGFWAIYTGQVGYPCLFGSCIEQERILITQGNYRQSYLIQSQRDVHNLSRHYVQALIKGYQSKHQEITSTHVIFYKTLYYQMQKMNQQNYYSYPKKSIVSQLINTLHQKNIENHQYQLSKILKHKKAKLRQKYSLSSHEVIQPELCPPRPLYPPFTLIPPSCIGQEFISEKIKNNILRPERFYSSQPNVKAGSFSLPKKRGLQQNKIVVNNQFQEYSRLYDQQSGEFKHKKIIEMLGSNDLASKKQKYMRMKRTLFQKFMPDKYHFYNKIPGFNQKSMESSGLKKSLSKYVGIQQQKSMDDVKSYFKPGSSRQRNTLEILEKPKEIIELKRSMSGRKPRFTKNLQSLQ